MADGQVTIDSDVAWTELPTFAELSKVLTQWEIRIEARIRAVWPVDTGYSQSLWNVRTWKDGKRWVIVIRNSAEYAGFVRVKGTQDLVIHEDVLPIIEDLLPDMREEVEAVLFTEAQRRKRRLPSTPKVAGSPKTTTTVPAPRPGYPGAARVALRPPVTP